MTTPSWPLPATVRLSDLGPLGPSISAPTAQSRGIQVPDRHPEWLAKLYQQPRRPDEARHLDALVAAPKALTPAERDVLLGSSSWPVARITAANGSTLGCVIPKAPGRFKATLTAGKAKETRFVEVDWLAHTDEAIRRVGLPVPTDADRLKAVTSLVSLAAILDRLDLVYSDWSYSNSFWSPAHRQVYVIDIDGCQAGKTPNLCQPNWDDPLTSRTSPADKYTDRYRVALLATRCLTGLRDPEALRMVSQLGTRHSLPGLPEALLDCLLSTDRERRPSSGQLLAVLTGGPYVRPMPRPVRSPLPPARPPATVRKPVVIPPARTRTAVPTSTAAPQKPAVKAGARSGTGAPGQSAPASPAIGCAILAALAAIVIILAAVHH